MKIGVGLLLMGSSFLASAQKSLVHPVQVDLIVQSLNTTPPAYLAKQITAPWQTDRQKVTAIFRWIAENISYNNRTTRKRKGALYEEPEDTSRILKPLNQRVAEMVLQRRIAVCDGYARLFKTLCDHAGIPSEIIPGYARTGADHGRIKFRTNHTWNAVYIDSGWQLLDVTWASGFFTTPGNEYVQEYDNKYFLTPPAEFIRDHYPEDITWTLLKDPPALSEFYQGPFRYTGFIKSGITSYQPVKGIIDAAIGDSIYFEMEASLPHNILLVSGTPPVDSLDDDELPVIKGPKKARYTYTVNNHTEWLYVICDGEIIMRYKLNIKKGEDKTASISPDNFLSK